LLIPSLIRLTLLFSCIVFESQFISTFSPLTLFQFRFIVAKLAAFLQSFDLCELLVFIPKLILPTRLPYIFEEALFFISQLAYPLTL